METAFLPNSTLAELYRFAWLLSGEAKAAERVLSAALAGLEPQLEQIRSPKSRHVWLVKRIRQSSLEHSRIPEAGSDGAPRLLRDEELAAPEILEIEAYIVAQRFHALPEPDRTALALFYLDLLAPSDAAQLLGLSLEQYCETLGRARRNLNAALRSLRADAAAQPA